MREATIRLDLSELAKALPDNGEALATILEKLESIERQLQSRSQPEPVLLTKAQAAKRLGVSDRTLFSWCKAGIVPVVTIDGRDWVRSAVLDDAMRKRQYQIGGAR